ncbi:MAG: HAMP domain-containing sensor histidine kinase [Spirosomataceae bacterium]
MEFLKRQFLLVLAIVSLLGTVIAYFTAGDSPVSATEDSYLALVQTKILDEIRQSNNDLSTVKNRIQQAYDTSFANLTLPTRHPYFIFRNQQLVYWSDHRYVPTYEQVVGDYPIKTFDWDGNKFIVNRLPFILRSDSLTIYSLINLHHQFNTDGNNPYLQSGYNLEVFTIEPQNLSLEQSNEPHNIYSPNKEFLFSIETPKIELLKNPNAPATAVWLGLVTALLWGVYVLVRMFGFHRKRRYEWAFLLLLTYLLVLRSIMLYFQLPFAFTESDLFNPTFFAATDFVPSLGDLLLNILVISIVLFYLTCVYFRTRTYHWLTHLTVPVKQVLSVLALVVSYVAFGWAYQQLNMVYEYSQYRLDFKLSIDFWYQPLKIACLIVFVVVSTIYFKSVHLLVVVFWERFNRAKRIKGLIYWAIALPIGGALVYFWTGINSWLIALHAILMLVVYFWSFPRSLYLFKYQTSIYFFLGALACASLGTYVIHQQELRKDLELKQEFGKKYLAENDAIGEFLLNKTQEKIKADTLIPKLMQEPIFARERVQKRIKENHLEKYLDKYATEVLVFDSFGNSIADGDSSNFTWYEKKYRQPKYQTSLPDLYFVNDVGNKNIIKQYIAFVRIPKPDSTTMGFVVLDLKLWDGIAQNGVFAEILTDSRLTQSPEATNYSYAIYDASNKMLFNTGSYNYEKRLPAEIFENSDLVNQGIVLHEYRHVGARSDEGRHIVVSSPEIPIKNISSNFSFLFLILVVYIILVMIGYTIRYRVSQMNINFTTKIQIYLNIAFLLPLLLVVAITLSIISSTLKDNQESDYLNLTKNISTNFQDSFRRFTEGTMSIGYLGEEIKKVAKESGRDISLFNTSGRLIASNQESFYKKGLLSKYANPLAYVHVIEDRNREILLPETLGTLNYITAYVGMKSYEGKQLGLISVPFYDAKSSFEKEVMDVIGSILNTFTSIFIALLVLSYFASTILTVPLRVITQKIRKTNLDKLNEPLNWKSDDEIGLLIGEYNKMLRKLEESKKALSNSEKQSAWREMAKQVAHEIKNPLTPMKLTLQQLQRTLPQDNPNTKRLIDRALNSLIDQIDNISDIANSFSDIAKMPIPKHEIFDIVAAAQSAVSIQTSYPNVTLKSDFPNKPLYVAGDRQLMGNAITNLIINGIQSVPEDRTPTIEVQLTHNDDYVTLEVQDNGSGIPDSVRNRVFIPSFSTKREGSGLGLALAKRGIEHAGGSIWFETVEDEGTTFFINLPLADKD